MAQAKPATWWAAVALSCAVAAPLAWVVTDRLEARNDFCNACHLPSGVALHREIRDLFDSEPAPNLAAAHARAGNLERDDASFRCADCHAGTSFVGKARVKALAAKDALVWAVGRFEEPEGMQWPLWDEDCSRCHAEFAAPDDESWRSAAFHSLPVHNVELGVNCVECHVSHERVPPDAAYFLDVDRVRAQCARCHLEFDEGQG